MLPIKKNLTTVNYNSMSNKVNKYIVVHYTGNTTDTAYNNTRYFKSVNRNASAHYFVDDNNIYQCVLDKNKAWHVGDSLKVGNGGAWYKKCTNSNSIGIEMCCTNSDVSQTTVNNTIELVKYLMKKYSIPTSHVIRHYDVTNKMCPAPMVNNPTRWEAFKIALNGSPSPVPTPKGKSYRAYDNVKNKWLPAVKTGTSDYAGNLGNGISGFKVEGLTYRAHDKVKKRWLPWVTGYNDYAGNLPNNIDAIQIKNATYRVYDNVKKKWLPFVNGTSDYAGNMGHSIGGIQIK